MATQATGPRIVVCGGVAGGATAATKARRESETAQITVLEKGPAVSFSNCGLPFYIGGKIPKRDGLFLTNPAKLKARYGLDVHVDAEVVKIDRAAKTVDVRDPDGSVRSLGWDKLILAQGADAVVPPLPGIKASNISTLKTVPDVDMVMGLVQRHLPKSTPINAPPRAVVVGCGYIGLEVAGELHDIGFKVTCVDLVPQVLPNLDPDMAQWVERRLKDKGVEVLLGNGVKGFVTATEDRDGRKVEVAREVELDNGKKIPADLIILSIGVRPDTVLARQAGLEIGTTGGVKVNEYCQSVTDPDVYVTGDMAEITHLVTGKPTRIALAAPANKMGRVAGANAASPTGPYLKFPGAMGSSIIGVLGLTAAATGLSEKQCKQFGYDYEVAIMHANQHTGVYPGAKQMHLKVLYEKKTGKLLGAQGTGEDGVDKRIDVIATAIYGKLTIDDLQDLDLCYAPQYGAAKDPVNLLGWVAGNVQTGYVKAATYDEMVEDVKKSSPAEVQFLDMRDRNEIERDGVPKLPISDAKWVNIPFDNLRSHLGELDSKKKTYLLCHSGLRSYLGCRVLQQHGFEAYNVQGGMLQVPTSERAKL